VARVKWNTGSIRYIDSMWSNTEDWQAIRKAPELVTMFGGKGSEWVSRLNSELHQAQIRRKQKVEDGYKFSISFDEDRLRMRIWTFTARAMAHEAKHQSILRLMRTSGFDVNEKGRARAGGTGGGRRGGSSTGEGRRRPPGGSGGGSGGREKGSGGGSSAAPPKPPPRRMDPAKEARMRRQLVTLDALANPSSGAPEGERKLAAERARRFRAELGEG
jgi:hypothetical protein